MLPGGFADVEGRGVDGGGVDVGRGVVVDVGRGVDGTEAVGDGLGETLGDGEMLGDGEGLSFGVGEGDRFVLTFIFRLSNVPELIAELVLRLKL